MKRNKLFFGIPALLAFSLTAFAQSEDELNRSVTVERDFQPVIQAAGKISVRPAVIETTIEPAPIEYSDYTADVIPAAQFNPLLSQPTRFEAGKPYNGYVSGGLGHANTLFDFGYHLDDGKNSILNIYAHHRAQWGLHALSKTTVGLEFTHPFSTCDLYFGVNGGNIFYRKYGHFYDYDRSYLADATTHNFGAWTMNNVLYPKDLRTNTPADKTSLWTIEAFLGVKANAKQDFQYRVQTGYKLYSKPGAVSEHQLRTHADFDWHREAHHVGMIAYVQNNFLQLGSLANDITPSQYNSRHNFRFEPYYAYDGKRVQLHVGVNLDMNIGQGKNGLSGTENLSFAPSPNVHFEAQVAKQWLTVYADAVGSFGLGSLQEFMEDNRYRLIHAGIIDHNVAAYTPVDGEAGFHIRPYRDLLIEIHGGYAYMLNQTVLMAYTAAEAYTDVPGVNFLPGDFGYEYATYNRGKVGGQINYHFRDVVRINLNGDYYFWSGSMPVYDRANWELGLRVDGRIDQHWSLYSDNHFAGSRIAKAKDGEHILRPTIELDLGLQYEMWVGKPAKAVQNDKGSVVRPLPQPNLVFFLQLNNFIHRKNDIYYGYRSEGINFLLGATYRF